MGALFATHLVSLRSHVFSGVANAVKEEKVGNILYPIFRSCKVPFANHRKTRTKKPTLMDDASLQHSNILRAGLFYEFTQLDGTTSLVKLPNRALTAIDSEEALRFTPPAELLTAAPPAPPRRSSRRRATTSTAARDDDDADDTGFAGARHSTGAMPDWSSVMLPPQPAFGASPEEIFEYKNTRDRRNNRLHRRIWASILGCVQPPSPPSPTRRQPTPERGGDERQRHEDAERDDESVDRRAGSRPTEAAETQGMSFISPGTMIPYPLDPFQISHPHETYYYGSGSRSTYDPDVERRRSRSPRD